MKYYLLLWIALMTSPIWAEGTLHPLSTDARGKVVAFNPNQIYAIRANYFISTDLIFGTDEYVRNDDVHLGDASSWDISANRNHLYLKAKKVDAGGNLTVSTNKYTYHFMLSVAEPDNKNNETLFLKFLYPTKGNDERKLALSMVNVTTDICQDKYKYNLQYSFTGDREQAPVRACDDGLFTYFKFPRHIELPAIFMVLPDRQETVVNYRIEKGYVVVERVGKAFTLRNGNIVTSVYNDKYIGDWNKVKG